MKSSVVVTTYNGGDYIIEQLKSIQNQTQKIDELIIVDDVSKDNTVELINSFISNENIKNWKVYINQENKGWKQNFRDALEKSTGDIVFLCDQDDIWSPKKISTMMDVLNCNKDILLLTSNYEAFYDNSNDIIKIHGVKKNTGKIQRINIEKNHLNVMRPGCTYAIRRDFLKFVLEHDFSSAGHDAILWRWAIVKNALYMVETPLIKYRRHSNNATISNKKIALSSRIEELNYLRHQTKFFLEMNKLREVNIPSNSKKVLLNDLRAIDERIKALQSRSLVRLLYFQIRNLNHYTTIRNMISDIIIIIKKI